MDRQLSDLSEFEMAEDRDLSLIHNKGKYDGGAENVRDK
jgi:hypothetical protein